MKQTLTYISVILIILALTFFAGFKYNQAIQPEIVTTSDTILIHDTIPHNIPYDVHHYHTTLDTVFVPDTIPQDVDTAAILHNYFTTYKYTRTFKDSLLNVTLTDKITQNKFLPDPYFSYRILRPQTVINNTTNITNYSRYVYLGLSVPIFKEPEYLGVNILYTAPKYYVGFEYKPFNPLYKYEIKAGIPLFKIKSK